MQITINLPDNLSLTEADLRQELAITLFRQELITLGTASHIVGMTQLEFQGLLSDRGISIHYDMDDYKADIESLRRNNWR